MTIFFCITNNTNLYISEWRPLPTVERNDFVLLCTRWVWEVLHHSFWRERKARRSIFRLSIRSRGYGLTKTRVVVVLWMQAILHKVHIVLHCHRGSWRSNDFFGGLKFKAPSERVGYSFALRCHEFDERTNLEMWTFQCQFCFLFVFPSILCFKMPCRLISKRPSITISRLVDFSPAFYQRKAIPKRALIGWLGKAPWIF